jgi:hypothetical protein
MAHWKARLLVLPVVLGLISACAADVDEIAQQVGDSMASVDESGGSTGTLAELDSARNFFKRRAPSEISNGWLENLVESPAYANCSALPGFGSCTSNAVTRTFAGCTVGAATFNGTVVNTWGGGASSCTLSAPSQTITRVPTFTVTGRRGATLTVSRSGTVGQRLTLTSGSGSSSVFALTNDGIQRVFRNASGTETYNFTTSIPEASPITITGNSRTNRVLSGGSLSVKNNLTDVTCTYVPTAVTWTSACNCPTSGSWIGTCSDGKSTTVSINGCGTASLTVGTVSTSVTFDRCYSI